MELPAADRAQVSADELALRGARSDDRRLTNCVDRVSMQGHLCHMHSLPRKPRARSARADSGRLPIDRVS